VADQAIAAKDSTPDEDDELELEPRDEAPDDEAPDDTESESAATDPITTRWAIRGAVVGAIAGGAAGAGVGMLVARRPEALTEARGALGGSGKQVARAAAAAAAEVMTSRRLNQLIIGDGNGDPSQIMKQTAREAGAAAAKAARDAIISLRREAIGPE
jgi:uncharacterized protein YcfJ